MSKLVVLKFDDDSEWTGQIPDQVERYMAGMADEIQRLRTENERRGAAMRDAMENCEVCRWEDTKERRCARCQTFDKLLGEHAALDAAGGAK